ncbi:MAG TPA: carbohydrate ABC transporter permease [Chloroflexi bacterium]|jgi:alpha-glucoside transport system permease protein|nr:carbohydrate ABC transporter permease [Chloroflexota bacterium]HPO57835.1 carbohydrate ABC transporter permease [Anaerolineaceae bacterium]
MNLPKLNRLLRRIPLHLVVLALTLIWIIPTIGLLVTSFRPVEDINTSGWWTVFSRETKTSTAYDQWCSSCHGEGQDVAGVDLSDPAVVSELNSALRLLAFMRRGHPDISQNGQMPTSQEAADIAATLQGLTGEEESARFTLDNYIDALVGYRGLQTYTSDCADGTPPSGFTCNFLRDLGNRRGMGRAFVNSLLVTIPATILPILFAGFAAYAFAWMDFRGRQVMFAILVALQVVPLQMTLVPIFRIYSQLGLNGTFLGVWLFHTGFGMPYAIYLMRNFLGGLPRDLFESAYLDGASHWTAFVRLAMPLAMPAIASLAIFQFLWVWNDLLVALVFLGSSNPVVTYQISNMVTSLGAGWQLQTAAAFISMILPLIVFFAFQRYFVRGMLAGAVKG